MHCTILPLSASLPSSSRYVTTLKILVACFRINKYYIYQHADGLSPIRCPNLATYLETIAGLRMALGEFWPWSWMVAALVILATICVALQNQTRRSSKGKTSLPFIGDTIQFLRGPRDFLLNCLTRLVSNF